MAAEDQWSVRINAIDERLRPIATRPVDITVPGWADRLRTARPLDEAGVRQAADELLRELVGAYAAAGDAARVAIRALFIEFPSFAWAAALTSPPTTVSGFREHLLHFSIVDQGPDPRDATLLLDHLVRSARDAGVDVNPVLTEVASLSSREDRYKWGSTSAWLLRRVAPG